MSAAEALPASTESPWLIRAYEPESDDDDGLYYLLGISYARSRAGIRAGAARVGRPNQPDPDAINRQRAFLAVHRPIWVWLLEHADVTLACDPEKPHIIWAWLLTTGDVVHAVGAKRSAVEGGIARELVTDLLGDRLTRHQVCSLELPQMRTRGGSDALGIDRPREWSLDPTWLVTRMVGR